MPFFPALYCNDMLRESKFLLLIALCLTVSASRLIGEQGEQNVIYILDSTGSMEEKLGERKKIVVAKRVMAGLLEDMAPSVNLGLVVIGDKSQGCEDVPIAFPLDRQRGPEMVERIKKLAAKGTIHEFQQVSFVERL